MQAMLFTKWKGITQNAEAFIAKAFRFENHITICSSMSIKQLLELRDVDLGKPMGSSPGIPILDSSHSYAIYHNTHRSAGFTTDIKYDENVPRILSRFTLSVKEETKTMYRDCNEVIILDLGVTGIE